MCRSRFVALLAIVALLGAPMVDLRPSSGCTAAHLRSLTVGHEVIVLVTKGALDFGPWQRIFYGEWDGRRKKRVVIKVMGDK